MKQHKKKFLKKRMSLFLEKNAEYFPFIYQNCKIEVRNPPIKEEEKNVKFGHYETEEKNSYPFYKPISKIINFSALDE